MNDNKCPHCKAILDPIPQRKTKCSSCGKEIYVRTSPFNQQKLLLKRDDACSLDALKNIDITKSEYKALLSKINEPMGLKDNVLNLLEKKGRLWEKARLFYVLEDEEYFTYLQNFQRIQLLELKKQSIIKKVRILTARNDRTCKKCRALEGMAFTTDEAIAKMPLPVKCDNGEMCRCVYTYEMK